MTPTLNEGQIVVALKGSDFKTGDIIAFYYNNKILVKRVICGAGDWVNLARSGPGLPGTDAAFDRGGAACLGGLSAAGCLHDLFRLAAMAFILCRCITIFLILRDFIPESLH